MRLESKTSLNTWGQGTVHKRGEEHTGRLEWVETSVRMVARVKGKIYELVMRLAMMCGLWHKEKDSWKCSVGWTELEMSIQGDIHTEGELMLNCLERKLER